MNTKPMRTRAVSSALAVTLTLTLLPTFASAQSTTVDLRVMTFNIWVGGTRVSFPQVAAAIRAAQADIVGLQETNGNIARLAQDLGGWSYAESHQIVSRFPIIALPGQPYVLVEVAPGAVVAVSNVHLTAYPYGPYDLSPANLSPYQSAGAPLSVAQVIANEQRVHMNEMATRFDVLPRVLSSGIPVFLTGDFNVPSHLDWTARAATATPRSFDLALAWPVSTRLAQLGFRDSFREVHRDEVTRPGYTWTPGYPPPQVIANEVHDRIDFVYAAGSSTTLQSAVVGEVAPVSPLPGDFGGPHADIVVSPWPSDHRAVVSTFRVQPAPRPVTLTLGSASVRVGDPIRATVGGGPGNVADWVGIYPVSAGLPDGSPAADVWAYLGSNTQRYPAAGTSAGTVEFSAATAAQVNGRVSWPLPAGDYVVYFLRDDGYAVLASAPLQVVDPSRLPTVVTDRASYPTGEPITVTWTNGPGNARDWIGVYPVSAGAPDGNPGSDLWKYISSGAQTPGTFGPAAGSTTFSAAAPGSGRVSWPLAPGDYIAYFLRDDGYDILASAPFTIRGAASSPATLILDEVEVITGEPIVARVTGGPGNRADWVGIYPVSAGTPDGNPSSDLWAYIGTNTQRSPSTGVTSATVVFSDSTAAEVEGRASWPLPPGEYRVYFLANDGYAQLASAPLRVLEEPLYRARSGDPARGERAERIFVERNVRLASARLGYVDDDPDGDGWAVVGRTNGAGDDGVLARFWMAGALPWAATRHSRNGCLSLTPQSLAEVRPGQTRLMSQLRNTPDCRAEAPGFDADGDGLPDDIQPLYALEDDGRRITLKRSSAAAEAQLGVSDWDPDGDGWAVYAVTNGAGEYGRIVDLVVDGSGEPTIRVEHARLGCQVLRPNVVASQPVGIGQTRRLVVVARPGGTCAPL